MKQILFIADFFKEDLAGGGESNDHNLINHLEKKHKVSKERSDGVSLNMLDKADFVIVGNFVQLSNTVKKFLIENKDYVIYEHDHKYVNTRDPSKFRDFCIPESSIINKEFYESSKCTVVLSKVCKEVLNKNLPKVSVHNIGCSLWSEKTFDHIRDLSSKDKTEDLCILNSANPTKNYLNTVSFCKSKNLDYTPIHSSNHLEFLELMSSYKRFLFIPTVLETFSRVCAEAKMLNLRVMTNKKLVGLFSEKYSSLQGLEMLEELKSKNTSALKFFEEIV